MMEIPLRQEPNQSLQIVLGGQNCTIRLVTRGANLYCDLAVTRSDGTANVWTGVICRAGVGLKLYDHQNFAGQLLFVDMAGRDDPRWAGLGDRWRLVWLDANEAADWREGTL